LRRAGKIAAYRRRPGLTVPLTLPALADEIIEMAFAQCGACPLVTARIINTSSSARPWLV
jgi:hypothetical protein